jgi:hypothetical protein
LYGNGKVSEESLKGEITENVKQSNEKNCVGGLHVQQ